MADWIGTCDSCGRLVHKDGLFRSHPAGGSEVGMTTGTGCKLLDREDEGSNPDPPSCWAWGCKLNCTRSHFTRTGYRHRDCGVAGYVGAPFPSEGDQA